MPENGFNKRIALALVIIGLGGLTFLNFTVPLLEQGFTGENPTGGGDTGGEVNKESNDIILVQNVTIMVTFLNGTVETRENLTVDDGNFTIFALMDREFDIEYKTYSNYPGYIITGINGASGGYIYKVDGVLPGVSSSLVTLKNNTLIEFIQVS